jgi:hypothetical protein
MIIVAIFSITAHAEIYKSVDKNGVVTYSDQPDTTSQTVQLPALNVVAAPTKATETATNSTNATDKTKHVDYTDFTMSSQKEEDTIWNADSLPVSVNITPALQEGDTIQFLFDGAAVIPALAATSASIPKVINDKAILVRGTHTLSANVLNANGDILKTTPSITIYLHYTSLDQPNKR